jgi:hypothetical protein
MREADAGMGDYGVTMLGVAMLFALILCLVPDR